MNCLGRGSFFQRAVSWNIRVIMLFSWKVEHQFKLLLLGACWKLPNSFSVENYLHIVQSDLKVWLSDLHKEKWSTLLILIEDLLITTHISLKI